MQAAINKRNSLDELIEKQKADVARLKKKLVGINNKEFQDLLDERRKNTDHKNELIINRDRAQRAEGIANSEVDRLNRTISQLEQQGSVGEHLKIRLKLLDRLIKRAEARLEDYVESEFFFNQRNKYLKNMLEKKCR